MSLNKKTVTKTKTKIKVVGSDSDSNNEAINKENNKDNKISIEGKLYCLYNEVYKFYGENVYKLGNSKDIKSRLNGYTTSYIKPCELKLESDIFRNKDLAESILFEMLKEYRITNSREFFKCDLLLIKEKIDEVTNLFNKHKDDNELEVYLKKNIIKKTKSIFIKQSIVEAKDIDEYEYQELLRKQQINQATHNEKLSIEKYCYKVNWDVEKVDKKFMDLAYRKTHVLLNLRTIIFNDNKDIETIDKEYLDYHKTRRNERIIIVKDIIKELGYNSYIEKKLIVSNTFDENKENIIKNNILFTNQKFSLPLFGMKKRKILSIKSFMGFINSILKEYGFEISVEQKAEKHIGKTNYYYLDILKEFKNYLVKKKKNVFEQNMFI